MVVEVAAVGDAIGQELEIRRRTYSRERQHFSFSFFSFLELLVVEGEESGQKRM